jgi:quercetin dioxygenase-like cupin family protein
LTGWSINSPSLELSLSAARKSNASIKKPHSADRDHSVVLKGQLQVETRKAVHEVSTGQAIIVNAGEWVRSSTPGPEGAEYIAVCLPAFSPHTVHRDED